MSLQGKAKTNPAGLIFDCDGTLADSMPFHWQAWRTVTRRHGLNFSEERFYALGGVPSRDIFRMLCQEQDVLIDPLAAALEKEALYIPLIAQVAPVDAVIAIARENRGKIPMAVASGGNRPIIIQVLRHLGINEWFRVVVTSEDVIRQKPAPDIFIEAARQMGVDPLLCRGFEDTELGLQALRAAGMEAVDVRALYRVRQT